jgi:hypothetical protein
MTSANGRSACPPFGSADLAVIRFTANRSCFVGVGLVLDKWGWPFAQLLPPPIALEAIDFALCIRPFDGLFPPPVTLEAIQLVPFPLHRLRRLCRYYRQATIARQFSNKLLEAGTPPPLPKILG